MPNLIAELRVVDGGHDWDVWGPHVRRGREYVFQFLNQAPVAPMKASLTGTAQEERAGGVAVDASGNVYQALAAGGPVDGQPFAGDKDLVLVKDSPAGTRLWTRELGTTRLERAYGVALDAAGTSSPGTRTAISTATTPPTRPTTSSSSSSTRRDPQVAPQFGVPAVADRGYAIATDAGSNVYVTGYTRGNLGAVNQGDKDVYVAKLDPDGVQLWLQQFGAPARTRRGASPRQPTESASAA